MVDERRFDAIDSIGFSELNLTFRVGADFADQGVDKPTEQSAADYLPAMSGAFEAMASLLLGESERVRRAVRRRILALSTPADDETAATDIFKEILWDFAEPPGRFNPAFVVIATFGPLERALTEGFDSFPIGVWYYPGRVGPMELMCVEGSFSAGSLIGFFRLVASHKTAILTLAIAAAAATGPVVDAGEKVLDRIQVQQQITAVYSGEHCVTNGTIEVGVSDLLKASAAEMNFEAANLSPEQQARGVCFVQLALDSAGLPVGPIDGKAGDKTLGQLRVFAKRHGTKPDIKDETLRRRLAEALHEGIRTKLHKP